MDKPANAPVRRKSHKRKIVRRFQQREPKIRENTKKAMFIKGSTANLRVRNVMQDLAKFKSPDVIQLKKSNNIIHPFEDVTSLEFYSNRNDCSLFMLGSHSKKRQNNLVIGRMFDHHVLDMIELGIIDYKSMNEFRDVEKAMLGHKPVFVFVGDLFQSSLEHAKLCNLLLDFFRGVEVTEINLAGLDHVIVVTATPEKVMWRVYKILLKKSGQKTPRVELEEMGPSIDLVIRRTRIASQDLMKEALTIPKQLLAKKKKNITTDLLTVQGKVHMQQQDLSKLATRKMKAFKQLNQGASNNDENDDGNDNDEDVNDISFDMDEDDAPNKRRKVNDNDGEDDDDDDDDDDGEDDDEMISS